MFLARAAGARRSADGLRALPTTQLRRVGSSHDREAQNEQVGTTTKGHHARRAGIAEAAAHRRAAQVSSALRSRRRVTRQLLQAAVTSR